VVFWVVCSACLACTFIVYWLVGWFSFVPSYEKHVKWLEQLCEMEMKMRMKMKRKKAKVKMSRSHEEF
jgi:hypothetical protein